MVNNQVFPTCNVANEAQHDEVTCAVSQHVSDSMGNKSWSSCSFGRVLLGSLCLQLTLTFPGSCRQVLLRINLPDKSGVHVTFWVSANWGISSVPS